MSSPRRRQWTRRRRCAGVVALIATMTFLSYLPLDSARALGRLSAQTPAAAPQARVVSCPSPAVPVRSAPPLGASSQRTVALTFDDGPGAWTQPILDVLAREGVLATFFVVGQEAQARKDLLARIARNGHLLGNHSWSHPTPGPAGWGDSQLTTEIVRTESLLHSATGVRPCFFRPPYGVTRGVSPVTGRLGLSVALWSVDTRDWAQPPEDPGSPARIRQLAAAGLSQEHPVVLMHDGGGNRRATLAAVSGVITDYRARGYQFVRLDGRR